MAKMLCVAILFVVIYATIAAPPIPTLHNNACLVNGWVTRVGRYRCACTRLQTSVFGPGTGFGSRLPSQRWRCNSWREGDSADEELTSEENNFDEEVMQVEEHVLAKEAIEN